MNNICHVAKSDETCIEDQWIFLGFLFRKDGILIVAGARVVMDFGLWVTSTHGSYSRDCVRNEKIGRKVQLVARICL